MTQHYPADGTNRQVYVEKTKDGTQHIDCGCCKRTCTVSGNRNHCSECQTTWCHMCQRVFYSSDIADVFYDSCGWTSSWCQVMHYCRFRVVKGQQIQATFCLFYWSLAWFFAITYPVWGLFLAIYRGWQYGFRLLELEFKNSCSGPGSCFGVCLLGIILIPFMCLMQMIVFYIPGILFAYSAPFIFSKTGTDLWKYRLILHRH